MNEIAFWLPVVWVGVIGFAIGLYVILDGFDLGIGILFPFAATDEERSQMMNSIAPFWDGNETWLVLGGGGLWIAFPKAFAIIMPALYIPVIIMLLALIFRGVAFEFRHIAKPRHKPWDIAFNVGSSLAAFSQGLILGGLIQGIAVSDGAFSGGPLDWLTPFSVICGFGLMIGYALLGAGFLIIKTSGSVQERSREQAVRFLAGLLAFILLVSVWTPLQEPRIAERWFSFPNLIYFSPVPVLTATFAYFGYRAIKTGREITPFIMSIGLFFLAYTGLAISKFPYIVPPAREGGGLDIWETAAAPESQIFVLIGVLVLVPIILAYTVLSYWAFSGKVSEGEGYH